MIEMFGKRLRELREAQGLTQSEVGEALRLSPSTIGMYESGRRDPDSQTLARMSQLFDVSTDYLLGRSNVRRPSGAKEDVVEEEWPEGYSVIARGAKKLTPEDKRKFIALIKAAFPDEFQEGKG